MVIESLALGDNLPAEEFIDSHGNCVCRVRLAPGSNCFRHNAIARLPRNRITTTSSPVFHRLPAISPVALLRYTLPSRYCDSDQLIDFAWREFGHIEHGMPRV